MNFMSIYLLQVQSTGTSLVALNLNASNKTEVISDDESGLSKIKLRINFARAWAALRRSFITCRIQNN